MLIQTPRLFLTLSQFLDGVEFCDSWGDFFLLTFTQPHLTHQLVWIIWLTAYWALSSTLISTYWAQRFLLLVSATSPLTPGRQLAVVFTLCEAGWEQCSFILAWSHTLGLAHTSCGVCFVGNLYPASLIDDPFLNSAVDTSRPLRCTTWNGDVCRSNLEYICTGNINSI